MFRWQVLRESDRPNREERYLVRKEEFNIQAQNGVRIWASNAAVIKMQAIGGGKTVSLELGSGGEVIVDDISWIKDNSGRYNLVLSRLES
jgi:hypothetical protein